MRMTIIVSDFLAESEIVGISELLFTISRDRYTSF